MTDFLPNTSDNEPTTSILIANAIVVDDKVKLETAGEMWNSFAISGSNGCVLQRIANVLNPPANKAKLAIRKLFVPRFI